MKKKIIIPIAVIIILVLLFVPFYVASFDDGGTRVYGALTYKAVAWKKIYSTIADNGLPVHGTYQNTSVFWYPDSQKNIDELWEIECDNHLLGAELGAPTLTKCPDSVLPTSVFDTKNIKRITFYIDYGLGKGNDVSADDMEEIIKWLETFTIDKKVDGTSPPGTNTIYVEIEYLDGTIVKNGIDKIEVDGASYYIKRAIQPDCLHKILTK